MVNILGFQLRFLCNYVLAIKMNHSRPGLNVIENCLQISIISDWASSHCQLETKENLLILKKTISFIASAVLITHSDIHSPDSRHAKSLEQEKNR